MKGTPLTDVELRRIEMTLRRDPVETWTARTVADLLATVAAARQDRAVPIRSVDMLRNRFGILRLVARRLAGETTVPEWSEGERVTYSRMLRGLGLHLITATAAAKQGLRIKRGAQPIATGYFGAPIQRHAELYVLELQCRPAKTGK